MVNDGVVMVVTGDGVVSVVMVRCGDPDFVDATVCFRGVWVVPRRTVLWRTVDPPWWCFVSNIHGEVTLLSRPRTISVGTKAEGSYCSVSV